MHSHRLFSNLMINYWIMYTEFNWSQLGPAGFINRSSFKTVGQGPKDLCQCQTPENTLCCNFLLCFAYFREDIDAPDLTVLDFNTISPVKLHSLDHSIMDTLEMKQEKEAFHRYRRRELEYWGVSCFFNVIVIKWHHAFCFNPVCWSVSLYV